MSIRFKSNKFLQTLGPGILFASTAIGVSHLIQSTKAGANYGFTLILFILAANIFKFPFFEFGSRYASATGTSLLEGYKKMHWSILLIYLVITLISMFFVCAAVTFVAAGLQISNRQRFKKRRSTGACLKNFELFRNYSIDGL